MEPADIPTMDLELSKVLAAGSAEGHRVELHEYPDGSFVITCDGAREAVYQAGACNLESCIKSFLAFLASFKEAIVLASSPRATAQDIDENGIG